MVDQRGVTHGSRQQKGSASFTISAFHTFIEPGNKLISICKLHCIVSRVSWSHWQLQRKEISQDPMLLLQDNR